MDLRAKGLMLLAALSLRCTSQTPSFFTLQLAGANGQNPFSDASNGAITLDITQAQTTRRVAGTVANGIVQLSLPITSYASITEFAVRAELDGGRTLVGAVGPFVPTGYGFARAVLGLPLSCATLSNFALSGTSQGFGIARFGSNLVLLGGTSSDGDTRQVFFGNTIQLSASESALTAGTPLTRAPGVGQLFSLNDRELIFVGERRVFRYAPSAATMRDVDLTLFDGAGSSSGTTQLASGAVVVVGGTLEGSLVNRYARMNTSGEVSMAMLRVARAHAAVVELSNGLVVVAGGNTQGALFEVLDGAREVTGLGDIDFARGNLFADPTLPIAYFVPKNSLESYRLDCRQDPCVASRGAALAAALDGSNVVKMDSRMLLIGGARAGVPTAAVTEIVFREDGFSVQPLLQLSSPRESATAIPLTSTTFLVVGGRGVDQQLNNAEICWL